MACSGARRIPPGTRARDGEVVIGHRVSAVLITGERVEGEVTHVTLTTAWIAVDDGREVWAYLADTVSQPRLRVVS